MNNHRYLYLYLPLVRFYRRLAPGTQMLLSIAGVGLASALVVYQLGGITGIV